MKVILLVLVESAEKLIEWAGKKFISANPELWNEDIGKTR